MGGRWRDHRSSRLRENGAMAGLERLPRDRQGKQAGTGNQRPADGRCYDRELNKASTDGVLAFQLHAPGPMLVQFTQIQLNRLR